MTSEFIDKHTGDHVIIYQFIQLVNFPAEIVGIGHYKLTTLREMSEMQLFNIEQLKPIPPEGQSE